MHLARNFRRLAGFTDDEIAELVDIAAEAYAEAQARSAGRARHLAERQPLYALSCSTSTRGSRGSSSSATGSPALWALAAAWLPALRTRALWWFTGVVEVSIFVAGGPRRRPGGRSGLEAPQFHMFYGFVAIIAVGIIYSYRNQMRHQLYLLYGLGGLFVMGLGIRAMVLLTARTRFAAPPLRFDRLLLAAAARSDSSARRRTAAERRLRRLRC